jgi:hypothetical protein
VAPPLGDSGLLVGAENLRHRRSGGIRAARECRRLSGACEADL